MSGCYGSDFVAVVAVLGLSRSKWRRVACPRRDTISGFSSHPTPQRTTYLPQPDSQSATRSGLVANNDTLTCFRSNNDVLAFVGTPTLCSYRLHGSLTASLPTPRRQREGEERRRESRPVSCSHLSLPPAACLSVLLLLSAPSLRWLHSFILVSRLVHFVRSAFLGRII